MNQHVDPMAVIRSLQQQIADAALQVAMKDATIASLEQQVEAARASSEDAGE